MVKNIALVLIVLSLFGCETWKFINSRGDMSKYVPKETRNSIFPPIIDVSSDNKVYFTYSSKKGSSICSVELSQLTEDGGRDFYPVVSHNGEKVLFKRGYIFGIRDTLWIVNSDGTNSKIIVDKDMRILDVIFSKNDSTIYFIGGALFSDSTSVLKSYSYCQDVFSVDINGNNFRRITYNCATGWIYDLKLIDDNHILVSIGSEFDFDGRISDNYKRIKKYYDKNQNGFYRKPYPKSFLGLINIRTGEMEEIKTTETSKPYKEPLTRWQKKNKYPIPLLINSAYSQKEDDFLYGNYDFYKFSYTDQTIKYSFTNDSIGIFNYKFVYNQNKLIGVNTNLGVTELILFDVEKNKLERRFEIDTTKFLPSTNRTIFSNE
ncbi:MAG: hypothetical protein KFKLKKLM_02197 [Flavobacteriales bacterium]|nr:hypothetical protein [Flavobacteriales bacterium]